MSNQQGYYNKYRIEYADGRPIPTGSVPFVLMLDRDPHARSAAHEYANSVEQKNPTLAGDLRALLANLEEGGE